jgi:CBS domain-containing protein
MQVRHILRDKGRQVVDIEPEATLRDACRKLVQHNIGALAVCDRSGRLAGLISERDIVRAAAHGGCEALETRVLEHMARAVEACSETDSIDELMEIMTHHRLRHLPVVQEGQLSGIVSIGDVVKTRIEETVQEAASLREYIAAR